MNREKIRTGINIFIAVAVPAAWIWMALGSDAALEAGGLENLKFFTVLSNIMEGVASVIWLLVRKAGDQTRIGADRFKYVAATSVFLTFATVMLFLGPLYGYGMMFVRANLFYHLLVPVAAVIEIIFFTDTEFTLRDNNIAMIPPVVYGVFYIVNVLINGTGVWPDTNDWYLFLAWGYPVGVLIFAVLTAVTWLLAFLMRKAQRKVIKQGRNKEIGSR